MAATNNPRSWSTITETTTLKANSIVFTAGTTTIINTPAELVFKVITDYAKYSEWNTWCPKFTVEDNQPLRVGSRGTLHVRMQAQNRDYEIPEEILELENGPASFKLSWRGGLLPAWAGVAERVQIVEPVPGDGSRCQVKAWESMSGFASYILKYVMGVPAQLEESNLLYANDLKRRAEALYGE